MRCKISFFCFFAGFTATILGQTTLPDSLVSLFNSQLNIFPQEKIYVHTDKPYYITGEQIWFRAHLVDAISHIPAPVSRYVYVELINPLDSVVNRVKIRQEEGSYHGYLPISDDIPEGDYILRAYTSFMRSQDEHYFFTKNVRIGVPQAQTVQIEEKFFFESDSRVHVTFRFTQVGSDAPIVPLSIKVSLNEGRQMNIKPDDDGTASINFNLPINARKRIMLLEAVSSQNPYRRFISIPTPEKDFDVAFYPEGGSILVGANCNVSFKAMKSNGQSTDITGVVYDNYGNEIKKIASDYLGMGIFSLRAEKGKSYYAICETEKEDSKRFDLPTAIEKGVALSVNQTKDRVYVSVLQPAESAQNNELYLFAHTRGIVHFAMLWDNNKNQVVLQKEQFPSGVLHFILFDAGLNPVSERLLFVNNQDQALVAYQPDRTDFTARSLVKNRITITDSKGEPLEGSFSVAVTSDKEVMTDSTFNILSHLLLTSDLRGTIENPAYYFRDNNSSAYALDLLMRTQGWRRYNITEVAKGRFSRPTTPIEIGAEISGTVKSVLTGKTYENIEVTAIAYNEGESNYFSSTQTNKEGRFYLYGNDFDNSTKFIVSTTLKKNMTRMNLILDEETFPNKTLPIVPHIAVNKQIFAGYAEKVEQQYVENNGIRVINLPEVSVTAKQEPHRRSQFYSYAFMSPNSSLFEEDLETFEGNDIIFVLNFIPGVRASRTMNGFSVSVGSQCEGPPLLLVDDMPTDLSVLGMISVSSIAQIDVIKCQGTSIFGMRGMGGAISIFIKDGTKSLRREIPPYHIKSYFPLGYQQPVEFYSPKYDTPEKRNSQIADLRTTIHWQPVVQTDSLGVATFEFYTADEQNTYSVIIEGLTNDGSIIRKEGKISEKHD